MRFYAKQHNYYCGIDLHARTMHLCILDSKGQVVLHDNIKANPIAQHAFRNEVRFFDVLKSKREKDLFPKGTFLPIDKGTAHMC